MFKLSAITQQDCKTIEHKTPFFAARMSTFFGISKGIEIQKETYTIGYKKLGDVANFNF
jgi:hypothetical protein